MCQAWRALSFGRDGRLRLPTISICGGAILSFGKMAQWSFAPHLADLDDDGAEDGMQQDLFCDFFYPVVAASFVLVLLLLAMAPTLRRELATRRSPPAVRLPPRS